jgi:hypothetical protein
MINQVEQTLIALGYKRTEKGINSTNVIQFNHDVLYVNNDEKLYNIHPITNNVIETDENNYNFLVKFLPKLLYIQAQRITDSNYLIVRCENKMDIYINRTSCIYWFGNHDRNE